MREVFRKSILSINTLELLDSGENLAPSRQITLRGDNTIACNAVNTCMTHSLTMGFSLTISVRVCCETNDRCWMMHLSSKTNVIADLTSGEQLDLAEVQLRRLGEAGNAQN